MFKTKKDITGTNYIEFQYCNTQLPLDSLLSVKHISHWKEDSLYINDNQKDMALFTNNYLKCFLDTNTPDNSNKYSPYGINYYTKNQTKLILDNLLNANLPEKSVICDWLQKCLISYNGFYILGI